MKCIIYMDTNTFDVGKNGIQSLNENEKICELIKNLDTINLLYEIRIVQVCYDEYMKHVQKNAEAIINDLINGKYRQIIKKIDLYLLEEYVEHVKKQTMYFLIKK